MLIMNKTVLATSIIAISMNLAGCSSEGETTPLEAGIDVHAPGVTSPDTSAPDTSTPDTSTPDTSTPDTSTPDTSNPDTSNPDTSNPDTSNPDTSNPDTSNPDTTNPDTSNPDTTNPDTSNPDTTNPDTSNPDTSNPDTTDPDATDANSESSENDSSCQEAEFISGTTYAAGDIVLHNDETFTCQIGGWCSSPVNWAYEPGAGSYWQDAWSKTANCDASDDSNSEDNTSGNSSPGMFAPFVDATAWPPFPLEETARNHNIKTFALGFLVDKDGASCEASWGTYYDLEGDAFNTEFTLPFIANNEIDALRKMGGDVMISIGGASNTPLAAACSNAQSLANEYMRIINRYQLTKLDFDIEGHWVQEPISIEKRSQAIALLQTQLKAENKSVSIWFTLPTLPSGLAASGTAVVQSALDNGVELAGVNVMTMDYGNYAAPNPQGKMAEYAIQAGSNLHTQLKTLYSNAGQVKNNAEIWNMIGLTPMIGLNDVTTEVFDLEDAQQLLDFAQTKELGLLSMWSINRDKECESGVTNNVSSSCSSVNQSELEFSTVFNAYNSDAANDDSANDDSANDDSANDDSANDDSANDDSANDDSANDDSANDDSANDDSANDDSANDDSANDDSANDDSANDDSANDDSANDDSANTNPDNNTTDKVVVSYFVEWGVYGRNYHVADIPAEKLTHVLYGFIPVCGPNTSLQEANPQGYSALVSQCAGKPDYSVVIHDKFAALEKSYPGDKWDNPVRGNFGQMIKMKQQHPHIKVIPSIGGWTLSDPFFHFANDAAKRAVFVNSVKEFLTAYDFFDGIDIDWEFPGGEGANTNLGSESDYQGYADLMKDLRTGLNELENSTGKEYELTSAIGSGPARIDAVNYTEAHQYMDYIFAMTYDYYGAWGTTLGHQTALHDYSYNKEEGFYATSAVDKLITVGVPSQKIVIGAAMYGRGWSKISGGDQDFPFTGVGTTSTSWQGEAVNKAKGTWEDGVLDYKDIAENYLNNQGEGINGYTYYYDEEAEAPYLWNPTTGTLITYDNPKSVRAKAKYALENDLGGIFSWEIDADNGDIINAMSEGLQP
jgi:GH18 family chitinase